MAQGKDTTALIPRLGIKFETVAFTTPEAKRTDVVIDGQRTLGVNGSIPQNLLELAIRLEQEADNLAKANKEMKALLLAALKKGVPVQDGPRTAQIKTRATNSAPYKDMVEALGTLLGWGAEKLEGWIEPQRKRGVSEGVELG